MEIGLMTYIFRAGVNGRHDRGAPSHMVVAVQYYALPEKVYDAFYKFENVNRQITSFVFDVVRAQVPKIKLDDVFEKKDDIANIVESELAQAMEGFGYGILKALVTDIDPNAKVKESMNEINAAQRMRVAATERGEADRILRDPMTGNDILFDSNARRQMPLSTLSGEKNR